MLLELFERLKSKGYIKRGKLVRAKISAASLSEMADLSSISEDLAAIQNLPAASSYHTHSASISLGGGAYPCAAADCRIERLEQLAQFAVLYSDKVYVRNFFGDMCHHIEGAKQPDIESFRLDLWDDLAVLLKMKPLVKSGVIVPVSTPHVCPHCSARRTLGPDGEKRSKREQSRLAKRYLESISIKLKLVDDLYVLSFEGPEILLEHGGFTWAQDEPPASVRSSPRIMAHLQRGQEVCLSRRAIKDAGLHKDLAKEVFYTIGFELLTAQGLNTSFLTDLPLHIDVLNSISDKPKMSSRNQVMLEHMTSLVPVAMDVPIQSLLKLRRNEHEAFLMFRQAISKAIDEVRAAKGEFTARDARGIYGDILEPELARLDAKVKSARRTLVKRSVTKAASWVGAISIGMYAGFVPSDLMAAASALGLTQIVASLASDLLGSVAAKDQIRSEDMYFLWRIREKGKKR